MDWDHPSPEQVEVLVTGMQECFPDNASLHWFINERFFKLSHINPIMPLTIDELVRFYVGYAIKRGCVGELHEKLLEMPQFAQSLEDQNAKKLESTKRFLESLPKHETHRDGFWTKPRHEGLVLSEDTVAEPNWDDLSGKQLKVIRDAIEKAFPNPKDFDIFLSDINQRPLSSHSAAGGFPHQLHDFLKDVQAEGWARELVKALKATKRLPLKNLTSDLEKATR